VTTLIPNSVKCSASAVITQRSSPATRIGERARRPDEHATATKVFAVCARRYHFPRKKHIISSWKIATGSHSH